MTSPASVAEARPVFPQIIVVHGPAGGVGKTTLALHLAYAYADKGHPTVLVDLSQYGTLAAWLRIPRGTSSGLTGLITALEQGGAADPRIRDSLVPAPAQGDQLHLVLSSGPAKMDQVQAAAVDRILRQLALTARIVVVDTSSELTDRVLGALLAATHIVLPVAPHVSTVWHALELVEILRSAYIPKERIAAVFNRIQPGGRFGLAEYEQALGLPVVGTIPEAPDLRQLAEDGGTPDTSRRSRGMLALRRLAHCLVPTFTPKELKRPWPWSK